MNEDGTEIILPHPTFELTDGWYKIRTKVDEALARATRKRTLRVGTKIVVVGAKVSFVFVQSRDLFHPCVCRGLMVVLATCLLYSSKPTANHEKLSKHTNPPLSEYQATPPPSHDGTPVSAHSSYVSPLLPLLLSLLWPRFVA